IQEVESDLQQSEGGDRCFLNRNWLLRLVTYTFGCCFDKRFRWSRDSFGTRDYHRSNNALTISLSSATSAGTAGVEEFELTLPTTALARV
nr:hypothetical protein [Tanacetum cinerariifolium]